MKKTFFSIIYLTLMSFVLCGCTSIGDKTTSMTIIYSVTSLLSLIMLAGYFSLIKKKEVWFFILFTSVFVVNIGYLMLSVSKSLETALWANRIAYLGSVFLPLSMIMIIIKVSGLMSSPSILIAIFFIFSIKRRTIHSAAW